jgi:hypothetical protein
LPETFDFPASDAPAPAEPGTEETQELILAGLPEETPEPGIL